MTSEILSVEDIKHIHDSLTKEFSESQNPIFPPGVKSEDLLASAVFRQQTQLNNTYKYPDPYSNAATLTFGLCCDHPFHNGNKRTALVALLAHLYKNKLSFYGVKESQLFNLVLMISTHSITDNKKKSKHSLDRPTPDDEVAAISNWIRERVRYITKGERQITYHELRHILEHFGFTLNCPKGNSIDISKYEQTSDFLFRKKSVLKHIGNIPYPGDKVILSVKDIKYVRRLCNLDIGHGVDSENFYEEGDPIDTFIVQHRVILQRLANK
jgi:death-on-curing protein